MSKNSEALNHVIFSPPTQKTPSSLPYVRWYTVYVLPFVPTNSLRSNNSTELHLNTDHQPDLHVSIRKIMLGYLTSSEYLKLRH